MNWKNSTSRYGTLSIALHWLMLVLIAVVYFTMEFRGLFPKGTDGRELMKQTHFMLGLGIFALVWLRLIARVTAPTPQIVPAIPAWQAIPAKLMHLALYALMIGAPLLGWLILSAMGKPIPFFGLELPPLTSPDHDFGEQLEHWHVRLANAGYWLIGLHAVAGLLHHYVIRDNTLVRMLPSRE
jgi:cytochrome b561